MLARVLARPPAVWGRRRVSLGTSIFCLSLNTVILQEHSNSPFTNPGAFSSLPVTRRSILQHQRCRPPLFERTIRRRVRWPGWTMLEMTFLASVCLPLSLTFAVYDCWLGGGQRSKACQPPHPPLLPVDVLYSQLFQAADQMANRLCLLIWSLLPDKTVVFFRCSIWTMCKLMHVCTLTLCSHLRCTNILFVCGKIRIWNRC